MGKIIAGLIGWQIAGFFGAIIGLYIGSYFDRGFGGFSRPYHPLSKRALVHATLKLRSHYWVILPKRWSYF